jgi:polyisoprenoid-binding protein YceI
VPASPHQDVLLPVGTYRIVPTRSSVSFTHTRSHPLLTFDSTATVRTPGGWLIRGQLTARGRSAPVDLTVVTARADAQGLAVEAEGRVDQYAHGITLMKGVAARHVDLPIAVLAVRA